MAKALWLCIGHWEDIHCGAGEHGTFPAWESGRPCKKDVSLLRNQPPPEDRGGMNHSSVNRRPFPLQLTIGFMGQSDPEGYLVMSDLQTQDLRVG